MTRLQKLYQLEFKIMLKKLKDKKIVSITSNTIGKGPMLLDVRYEK